MCSCGGVCSHAAIKHHKFQHVSKTLKSKKSPLYKKKILESYIAELKKDKNIDEQLILRMHEELKKHIT
jgi:hypothetical protein